jgi:undecaprenyl-diphosphatase
MAKDPDAAIVERVSIGQALVVGIGQSAALFAGISRFGVSISFGMLRGLSRSVAADFAFLLAFPAILGASLFKLPKLLAHGALATGSSGPLLAGTLTAFIATFISVTFLVKYFKHNTLRPFALYCLAVGSLSILRFGIFGS